VPSAKVIVPPAVTTLGDPLLAANSYSILAGLKVVHGTLTTA